MPRSTGARAAATTRLGVVSVGVWVLMPVISQDGDALGYAGANDSTGAGGGQVVCSAR